MNWSTKPPTKPGFYLWRYDSKSGGYPIEVMEDGWCSSPATGDSGPVATRRGQWLRLVPAEEVEKAHREGWLNRDKYNGRDHDTIYKAYSRAKQIAEGTI